MSNYHYAITSLDAGSAKYGPCEICNTHVDSMYLQTESAEYEVLDAGDVKTHIALTQYNCNSYFGHKECLHNVRRI